MKTSENELAVIYQKLEEQGQELNKLRQALTGIRGNGNGNGASLLDANAATDRRGMLKKMAGLAVGVATVGLLRPSTSEAIGKTAQGTRRAVTSPRSKIGVPNFDNDPWLVGNGGNNATLTTGLFNTFFDLIPSQVVLDNIGTSFFVQPADTDIALVGHTDDEGSATSAGGLVGLWGEARSVLGARATGVFGIGTAAGGEFDGGDAGVVIKADRATLCLFSTTEGYLPTSPTPHVFGEIVVESNYDLWYSVIGSGGTTFRRLAGGGTAGSLAMLPVPKRIIDTRPGSGYFDAGNPFHDMDTRTYPILALSGGDVPVGTTAIIARATCMNNSDSNGGLQASPNGPVNPPADLGPGTAIVNFGGGDTNGNTFTSNIDSGGDLHVSGFLPGGGTFDVIIDIVGYYV